MIALSRTPLVGRLVLTSREALDETGLSLPRRATLIPSAVALRDHVLELGRESSYCHDDCAARRTTQADTTEQPAPPSSGRYGE